MANREENIKKINEQLEQLSDEQLEQVAGGLSKEEEEKWEELKKRCQPGNIINLGPTLIK